MMGSIGRQITASVLTLLAFVVSIASWNFQTIARLSEYGRRFSPDLVVFACSIAGSSMAMLAFYLAAKGSILRFVGVVVALMAMPIWLFYIAIRMGLINFGAQI
jgi:hypothetical protein